MRTGAPVIAVDGPVAVGKGALAHRLAGRLSFHLLDSGAIYRGLALASLRHGVVPEDSQALCHLAQELDLRFEPGGEEEPLRVFLEGEDVGLRIRGERCGQRASRLAADASLRKAVLGRQRAFRRPPGLVADGRDMGTVVFPDALLKVYLTASVEERARRRHKQLVAKGLDVSLPHLLGEIRQRDKRDQERSAAPLRPAEDAIIIDTTSHGIESVLERVMRAFVDAPSLHRAGECRQGLHSTTSLRVSEEEGASPTKKRGADSPR